MMTDEKPQPDETILGGESSVPDTAGSAAGGAENAPAPKDKDATKPPER
ncbi:hypothetical protein ACFSC3_14115 [Sphingomonas floccifaciens]|uniref:Uncharacterized protein n=1 Tax=Sphingomonas floccifaciens TaxID=1844115 RepID=A0ABW4NEY4_9SPHN